MCAGWGNSPNLAGSKRDPGKNVEGWRGIVIRTHALPSICHQGDQGNVEKVHRIVPSAPKTSEEDGAACIFSPGNRRDALSSADRMCVRERRPGDYAFVSTGATSAN